MDYSQYIKPELLVLIPVLYLLGVWIRQSQWISNRLIPLMLGLVGILLSLIYVLATGDLSSGQNIAMAIFTALSQGILIGGASVYANQIVKQLQGDTVDTNGQAVAINPTQTDSDQLTVDSTDSSDQNSNSSAQ